MYFGLLVGFLYVYTADRLEISGLISKIIFTPSKTRFILDQNKPQLLINIHKCFDLYLIPF